MTRDEDDDTAGWTALRDALRGRRGRWRDEVGAEWSRRGEQADPKRLERVLRDAETRVLRLDAAADVVEVPRHARAAYWAEVGPYLTGKVHRAHGERTQDHFECRAFEFRDEQRRVLVVFQESC